MALDMVEGFDLGILALQEIKAALADTVTPGKITKEEWVKIAFDIGQKAFAEIVD